MFILPFSHIRCRSVSNLPPLLTIFPDESSLEPAIDCRWKGTQNGEDGNEAMEETRGPCGDSDRLSGLVLLSDHSGPHIHSSLWRRCARGCSGSAMGRDHGWVEIMAFGQITTEGFDVGQCKYLRLTELLPAWRWSHQKTLDWKRKVSYCNLLSNSWNISIPIHPHQVFFTGVSPTVSEWQAAHTTSYRAQFCFCSTIYHFKRPNGQSADNRPCNTIWALLIKCRCGSSQCEFVAH